MGFQRLKLTSLGTVLLAATASSPAYATLSFDAPNASFTTDTSTEDSGDRQAQQSIASDGSGAVVVVWNTHDSLLGTIGTDGDIVASSSLDGGITWSAPLAVNGDAAGDSFEESTPVIATNGSGLWLAAWVRETGEVLVSQSLDNGASWSAAAAAYTAPLGAVVVSALGKGLGTTWIIAGNTNEDFGGTTGTDQDIFFLRSADDGASWGPVTALNSDAASDAMASDDSVGMASDGAGNWVAVWRGDGVESAGSSDDGATWSTPVTIATSIATQGEGPCVATSGGGRWIAVWSSTDHLGNTIGGDNDILGAGSDDGGATWSAPRAVCPDSGADDSSIDISPTIHATADGRWFAYWDSVLDSSTLFRSVGPHGVMSSHSLDDGLTWSPRGLVNSNATLGGGAITDRPSTALIDPGTWLVTAHSTDSFQDTVGSDVDLIVARSTTDCPAAPATGCIATTKVRGSKVKLKNGAGDKDTFSLTITRGGETIQNDLGDPLTSADYVLCGYDAKSAGITLIMEKDLPGGALCKGKACWRPISGGFSYKDPRREHSAVKSFSIKRGDPGRSTMKLKAKGATMMTPVMPFEAGPGVIFQVLNLETGTCWEAAFTTLQHNTTESLKAKSD